MRSFEPRFEALPAAQKHLWPRLRPTHDLGYVLYGGTAIALRLGHRASVDFDFFSSRPLDRAALASKLPFVRQSTVLQDSPNTLTLLAQESESVRQPVKVSFFGGIDFGRVGEPEITQDSVIAVASLLDLLATKLKVILQRAESKDYLDIAAIIQSGPELSAGLAAARELFGRAFQPSESLKALAYFDDGDLSALPVTTRQLLQNAAGAVRELPDLKLAARELNQTGN